MDIVMVPSDNSPENELGINYSKEVHFANRIREIRTRFIAQNNDLWKHVDLSLVWNDVEQGIRDKFFKDWRI